MSNARKKLTKAAGKSVKRPHSRNPQFITRAEARRRAARHVLSQMFKGATVRDGAEVGHNLYGVQREDVWVVYKNPKEIALKSSDVILVCKRTGRVLYEGATGDEG